jgi:hypothetical protein
MNKKHKFNGLIKICVYLCVSVAALFVSSCAEVARDMGIDGLTEVQMRAGLTGTQAHPAALDPFQKYELVMAANECRFFIVKVPAGWYWKVYVTAASRAETIEGRLSASIDQPDPPWAPLPGTSFEKAMVLHHDGDQALLAVGNTVQTRYAVLRLCQEGAPVNVNIESQTSTTTNLLGPDSNNSTLQKLNQ